MGADLDDAPCVVAPGFRPEDPLVIGDRLEPLPLGWHCHRVAAGETLGQLAIQYDVDVTQMRGVAWNRLPPEATDAWPLTAESYVRVPGIPAPASSGFMAFMLDQPLAVSPYMAYATGGPGATAAVAVPDAWPYGSGRFTWPVYGWLSQGYREDHRALDIAAPPGTFVTAADRGVVIRAGWNDQGYGNFVVIDHNIDYVTLYSHLAEVLVREGEVVGQGQIVGTVGSTGNSTGAHLHFEIRDFGRRTNPLELLMR
jgi:murein DD-endopeptidase MepM/ murein hydrolase activator NlpD